MNMEMYTAELRARIKTLKEQASAIDRSGSRMYSRWGSNPFVDVTASWRNELDRRIAELMHITSALEQGRQV
jgi:hypothetical protein